MAKKAASTKLITERFQMNRGVVVNREAGTIIGVRICGENSANGRRYRKPAFKESGKLYGEANSFYGHRERTFENLAGRMSDVTIDKDGLPRGTLNLITSDPYAEKLLWMAENCPEKIGLSHVAECKSHFEGGIEIIDEIVKVESVDIVIDPATNPKGFAESTGEQPVKTLAFKLFVEAIAPKLPLKKILAAKRLSEMDGVGDMEVCEPEADAPAETSLADALKTLAGSIVDEFSAGNLSADDAGAKITAFLKAHAGEGEKPAEDAAAEEARKKDAGAKPLTAEDVTRIVTAALAKHTTTEAERPKSGQKAQPKTEAKSEEAKMPTDAKTLKEFITAG